MKTIIKNIKELVNVDYKDRTWSVGKDMSTINTIEDAFIEINNGIISSFGSMNSWEGIDDWNNTKIIDADGGMVFPSYCDSHTHLVFAESREKEFVDRLKGLTYQEIAQKGGGILNSANTLQKTSEEELIKKALVRAKKVIKTGTGAIEIKSGYGLTLESELKILRVIKKLSEITPLTIKSTFLGAHAIPKKYERKRKDYIKLITEEMIPQVSEENLADFIDVFCEEGYFSIDETNKILTAAKKYRLTPKTHVNQFAILGGVELSVSHNALSVDHLEQMCKKDFEALQGSKTMPTMLPGCSFFLGIPYGPAKEIIEKNLPLALASDFNPGSSPNSNMNFIASLGCLKMNLLPEEVINATTINTAYAMGVENILGSIKKGKKANLFITNQIESYAYLPYSFGENLINKIILNGIIQE